MLSLAFVLQKGRSQPELLHVELWSQPRWSDTNCGISGRQLSGKWQTVVKQSSRQLWDLILYKQHMLSPAFALHWGRLQPRCLSSFLFSPEYVHKFDRKVHKFNNFRTKADSFRKNYRKKKGAYEPASNVLHSGLAPQNVFQVFSIWFSITMSLIIKGFLLNQSRHNIWKVSGKIQN